MEFTINQFVPNVARHAVARSKNVPIITPTVQVEIMSRHLRTWIGGAMRSTEFSPRGRERRRMNAVGEGVSIVDIAFDVKLVIGMISRILKLVIRTISRMR